MTAKKRLLIVLLAVVSIGVIGFLVTVAGYCVREHLRSSSPAWRWAEAMSAGGRALSDGDIALAEQEYTSALEEALAMGSPQLALETLDWLNVTYVQTGDSSSAKEASRRVLALLGARALPNDPAIDDVLRNLGLSCHDLGDYESSGRYWMLVVDRARARGEPGRSGQQTRHFVAPAVRRRVC